MGARSQLRAVLTAVVIGTAVLASPPPSGAEIVTARDLAICPTDDDPLAGVTISTDPFLLTTQHELAQYGYPSLDPNTAWALATDPLWGNIVGPKVSAGDVYWIESAMSDAGVIGQTLGRGITTTGYRIIVTDAADRSVVENALAHLADSWKVEIVVDPDWSAADAVWTQMYRRLGPWRQGLESEGAPPPADTLGKPITESHTTQIGIDGTELDRDISWLVDGVDTALLCRSEAGPLQADVASGAGWRLIARADSAHSVTDRADLVDWTGGQPVDFETEFVVSVALEGGAPRIAGSRFLIDGIDLDVTDDSSEPGNNVLVAIERSLVSTRGLALAVNRSVAGIYAEQGGRIVEIDSFEPTRHDTPLITGVDTIASPTGGVWRIDDGGALYATGGARYLGGMGGILLDAGMVAMTSTPSGLGYWMVAGDGGVFAFGDAGFFGSVPGVLPPGVELAAPIVGIETTPTGDGYWLVARDGGVFTFGDAEFYGSVPQIAPGGVFTPVVGIAATDSGYWIALRDGSVFGWGGVPEIARSVADWGIVATDIVASEDGLGYRLERGSNLALTFTEGEPDDEPALERMMCPAGQHPETHRPLTPSSGQNEIDVFQSMPKLEGGHWILRLNGDSWSTATDVIGNRQVRFGLLSIGGVRGVVTSAWIETVTVCEPDQR
ncbi:MAG: hypothetical protein GY708_07300 [Actinomycetia bacterium]|nr:hypothetical protein [Actinomycetes bacterium]